MELMPAEYLYYLFVKSNLIKTETTLLVFLIIQKRGNTFWDLFDITFLQKILKFKIQLRFGQRVFAKMSELNPPPDG